MDYGTNKYFQLTGSGDTGHLVVSAPRPVEEDLKLTPGSATLLPQPMVGGLVRGDLVILGRKTPATLKLVL